MMNDTELGGIIRHLITSMGTLIVGHGVMTDQWWQWLLGAVGILGGLYMSWVSKQTPALVTAVAAKPDVVAVVVASPELADSIPSSKVVIPPQYKPTPPTSYQPSGYEGYRPQT